MAMATTTAGKDYAVNAQKIPENDKKKGWWVADALPSVKKLVFPKWTGSWQAQEKFELLSR